MADDAVNGESIGAYLRAPLQAVDLAGYAGALHARQVTWRLGGAGALAGDPALPGKLRGAFGDQLLAAASAEARAGAPCPWSPPCAFEALFRKQGRMTDGTDFPDPWVIEAQARRNDLVVALTLFGIACDYQAAAAEAMTAALAQRVHWPSGPGSAPPILARQAGPLVPPAPPEHGALRLEMFAPLVVSDKAGDVMTEPRRAFLGLGRRLEGLARWQGLALEHDWRALSQALHALDFDWEQAEPLEWWRGSNRQNRRIPMRGVRGRLIVSGPDAARAAALPALTLGALTHVGADIVFGCGAYRFAAH